jgi:LL-diaminopimelate aminotransferase
MGYEILRESVAHWYERRYGVVLDPAKEIVALIGSKEGCHHFALAVVNPGDTVLVTDPGYPGYKPGIWFAGGEPVPVPVTVENDSYPF